MLGYKNMSHNKFISHIDKLAKGLEDYITESKIQIDYVCPVMRSGLVPAVYIANKLNIVKFAPLQVKHILYKNGKESTDVIFSPFNSLTIKKCNPIFLIVEGIHSTGKSVKLCIDEISKNYKDAKILYVCLAKSYNSIDFKDSVIYDDFAFYYKRDNKLTKKQCKELNIEYYHPLFPWEVLKMEIEHPDDLEQNIFF